MLLVPKPVTSWASQASCRALCFCLGGMQPHAVSSHVLQIDVTSMYQKSSSFTQEQHIHTCLCRNNTGEDQAWACTGVDSRDGLLQQY